jgi:charged multivesicular body protein 1
MNFFKKKQPAPVQQTADTQDAIFEMKMQAKMLERAAKKSDKEAKQQVTKARGALVKGNEEGAKLYLQNANMKNREALNNMKTGHRLEAVTTQIKSNENNMAVRIIYLLAPL